jgi:sterol-4alpha-carboxylate 3-dehydrogenase (decarboxylating)
MRTCSLRPAAIYGERDNDITPSLMRNYRQGRHRIQIGENNNLFNTTYAGNSADAHLLAAEKLLHAPEGVAGEAFFITNDVPMPFWTFGRTVYRMAGDTTKPEEFKKISLRMALVYAYILEWMAWFKGQQPALNRTTVRITNMTRYYNVSKARARLDWEPKVEWEEGLQRSVKVSFSSLYNPTSPPPFISLSPLFVVIGQMLTWCVTTVVSRS